MISSVFVSICAVHSARGGAGGTFGIGVVECKLQLGLSRGAGRLRGCGARGDTY